MTWWLTTIVVGALALTSCAPGIGDAAIRVDGKVIDQDGQPFRECTISLISAAGKRLQGPRHITGEFSETFVIAPRKRTYYVALSCVGGKGETMSTQFEGGTTELYRHPVQLGPIVLPRSQTPST